MADRPYTVGDVMTRAVVAVGQEASFKEVVETLERWRVSALPVLAGDGRVIGVVSEADLLPKEEFRAAQPSRVEQLRRVEEVRKAGGRTAGDLMSAPALTVHAGDTLAQAARTMAFKSVKRLPVVDGTGLLAGIVSRADLLKVFLRPDEELAAEVRTEILGRLCAGSADAPAVRVTDGVVTLGGTLRDPSLRPVLARLVQAVEGVVAVRFEAEGPALAGQRRRADHG
ncbi:CBS domain-containing protein [Streptomyces sp. NPDC058773]|uniref:CBS domain-containing protein n=1 Tax=Streptomyces sp. NPDC058773 TaxID=3346632 RepID=UPI0036B361A6